MIFFNPHIPHDSILPHITLESGRGLTVVANDVPIIKGSGFEYVEPNWSKSYYSSQYQQQQVKVLADGSTQMTFASDDGLASGSEVVRHKGASIDVDYVFNWSGPNSVSVEVKLGNLRAPVFSNGNVEGNSVKTSIGSRLFKSKTDIAERKFTADSRNLLLTSEVGRLEASSDSPMTLFDARSYEWADDEDLFWLGIQKLTVNAGHPVKLHCTYRIDLKSPKLGASIERNLTPQLGMNVVHPNEELPVLIPKPKSADLHFSNPVDVTAGLTVPSSANLEKLLSAAVDRRFNTGHFGRAGKLNVQVHRTSNWKQGRYELVIQPHEASISAGDDEGIRMGLERLASLSFAKQGHLWLPTGSIDDEPGISWRGVHLFVGPTANKFHRKLWDRVLGPLGFNHVVLQCERTAWKTLPGINTPITMKRADLVRLFSYYRDRGVDPIPLVQSFGHAEWMFAHNRNLDLALNPDVPYALDPRKPRTREVLTNLWDEIITNLKPKTVHFGLDEVDMRGWKKDPKFVTEMWKLHVPFLGKIASDHQVNMMLWGDKCLAPEEAVDAGFGDTLEEAAQRRSAIPAGAFIGDWHYAGNPNPAKFETSLKVWKSSGQRPIASSWFNSQNIRSFYSAAKSTGSDGALITTWAGYESSEETMRLALKQYSAMILAADYAWNPREDSVSDLPYDSMNVLKRMFFDQPSLLHPQSGIQFSDGFIHQKRIGAITFNLLTSPLKSPSLLNSPNQPVIPELKVEVSGSGHKLFLALSSDRVTDEAKEIARLEIGLEGGKKLTYPIRYGLQVRAENQKGVCVLADREDGISAVGFDLPVGSKIQFCRISRINRLTGLTLSGVSLVQ